jgi:hypothetical protein
LASDKKEGTLSAARGYTPNGAAKKRISSRHRGRTNPFIGKMPALFDLDYQVKVIKFIILKINLKFLY